LLRSGCPASAHCAGGAGPRLFAVNGTGKTHTSAVKGSRFLHWLLRKECSYASFKACAMSAIRSDGCSLSRAASVGRPTALRPLGGHTGFWSGRLTSSNVETWVLSNQDSNVAPQTCCVTGVRYQELCFSAFVLSTAIAWDDCRHFRNMRLRRAGSSRIVRCNQK
jgi:hypothetical protein